jgi:hypothetical protein
MLKSLDRTRIYYGFAYDDVSDQSSTLIETQPEHLELGIGW